MKRSLLFAALSFASFSALAGSVEGYYRKDGTYVAPHYRSNPNGTVQDNYSYRGNYNPYSGQAGQNSYRHDLTSPYYSGPNNNGSSGHSNWNNDLYH